MANGGIRPSPYLLRPKGENPFSPPSWPYSCDCVVNPTSRTYWVLVPGAATGACCRCLPVIDAHSSILTLEKKQHPKKLLPAVPLTNRPPNLEPPPSRVYPSHSLTFRRQSIICSFVCRLLHSFPSLLLPHSLLV